MTNIFLVESPLQLLSAIEAKKHFQAKSNILIVRYTLEQSTNEQLDSLLKLFNCNDAIKIKTLFALKISNYFILRAAIKLKSKTKSIDKVFIGEYRSIWHRCFMDFLNPLSCWMLDDGNITIELQNNYLPNNINQLSSTKKIKFTSINFIFLVLGKLRPKQRTDINVFTVFPLKPHSKEQQVIVHSFNYLKSGMQTHKKITNEVYFFGANLSELHILNEEIELDFLSKIDNYYSNQMRKIIYIPHRREYKNKLNKIKKLNITIRKFTYPAEIEFLLKTEIPCTLASYVSTALYMVPKLVNINEVDSFYIPPKYIKKSYRDEIESVYKHYTTIFNLVDIDELR